MRLSHVELPLIHRLCLSRRLTFRVEHWPLRDHLKRSDKSGMETSLAFRELEWSLDRCKSAPGFPKSVRRCSVKYLHAEMGQSFVFGAESAYMKRALHTRVSVKVPYKASREKTQCRHQLRPSDQQCYLYNSQPKS